jgi:hypothetical protein
MEIIILFFLLLILVWWFWLYRSQKAGYESAVHQKVKSLLSFSTPARQDETIRLISKSAADYGYRIQYLSQNEGVIILSDVVTTYKPAFYYPVYITQQLHASTEVEVGCIARAPWYGHGKMKKHSHEQCFYSITGALLAYGTVVKD